MIGGLISPGPGSHQERKQPSGENLMNIRVERWKSMKKAVIWQGWDACAEWVLHLILCVSQVLTPSNSLIFILQVPSTLMHWVCENTWDQSAVFFYPNLLSVQLWWSRLEDSLKASPDSFRLHASSSHDKTLYSVNTRLMFGTTRILLWLLWMHGSFVPCLPAPEQTSNLSLLQGSTRFKRLNFLFWFLLKLFVHASWNWLFLQQHQLWALLWQQ